MPRMAQGVGMARLGCARLIYVWPIYAAPPSSPALQAARREGNDCVQARDGGAELLARHSMLIMCSMQRLPAVPAVPAAPRWQACQHQYCAAFTEPKSVLHSSGADMPASAAQQAQQARTDADPRWQA